MFLRLGVALSKLRCTVEKTSGTVTSAGGRERPQRLFGRLKAKKVGSLPPDLVFLPRRLFLPAFRISGSEKKLLAPQTEEGAEEEAEGCSFCLLQVSSSDLLAGTAPAMPDIAMGGGRISNRLTCPDRDKEIDAREGSDMKSKVAILILLAIITASPALAQTDSRSDDFRKLKD